jgi:hypothetical protein
LIFLEAASDGMIRKAAVNTWLAAIIISMIFLGWRVERAASLNYYHSTLIKDYLGLEPNNLSRSDDIADDIPDGWQVEAWDGAREVYKLSTDKPFAGKRSASIRHTNESGAATLTQQFAVEPGMDLEVSAQTRGEAGAIRIQFFVAQSDERTGGVRTDFGAADEWQQVSFALPIPNGITKARVLLYAVSGETLFDEVKVATKPDKGSPKNLLSNSGFEQDGSDEDPMEWWLRHFQSREDQGTNPPPDSTRLVYANIRDLMIGNLENVQTRSNLPEGECADQPEISSYLIEHGKEIEKVGGAAAKERLYLLAADLAPRCPFPYAALGDLYRAHFSYDKAARYYAQAAELSADTFLAARYAFDAGLLHWSYTGNLDRAQLYLHRAENSRGWEPSAWHRGAAAYYLGRTFEDMGLPEEAAEAYQRVLQCAECTDHQKNAQERLNGITQSKEGNP